MNVREIRNALKLTQLQLADLIGSTRSTVKGWESGEYSPTGVYFERIQKLYMGAMAGNIPEHEIQLLRTLNNVQDLISTGKIDVKDVLDIIYEYTCYEVSEEILRKWAGMGFYIYRDTISLGRIDWGKLPKEYKKALKV